VKQKWKSPILTSSLLPKIPG